MRSWSQPNLQRTPAHPDHVAVEVAYHCAQDLRDVFHQPTPARGRQLAEQLIATLPSCPIPETA